MSETSKPTTPFLEEYDCVNSTQPSASFYSASADQAIASPSTIPNDCSEYAAENPLFVSMSTFTDSVSPEIPSLTPADVASMVAFIQSLRCSNTNLLETVVQLQQTLAQAQEELALQKEHNNTTELMLIQKRDDLADAEDQIDCLSDKLKTAHQTIQRQQISIKNLTTELATSQERIAQMERECSLTQSNYNEKSQILIETENSSRELRARLIRQQRYTMQLKVALEKCQDVPVRSFQSQADNGSLYITNEQIYSKQAPSLFPKAEPITPWAVQSLYLNENLEPTKAESTVSSGSHHQERLTTDKQQPTLFNSCTPSVEQGFFYAQDFDVHEDDNWQDLFNLIETQESEETDSCTDLTLDTEGLAVASQRLEKEKKADNYERKTAVGAPHQPTDSAGATLPNQQNSNWPSPVVYPLHPPKGRKSLSAIELPKFSQKRKG